MKLLYKARRKRWKREIETVDNGKSFHNVAILLYLKWDLTFSMWARSINNRRPELIKARTVLKRNSCFVHKQTYQAMNDFVGI